MHFKKGGLVLSKLNTSQRRQVYRLYKEQNSYTAVSRELGISPYMVKKIVNEHKSNEEGEGCKDFSAFLESKGEIICSLIDSYLDELTDPDRVKSAPLNQLASALGVVVDKFIKNNFDKKDSGRLDELIRGLKEG